MSKHRVAVLKVVAAQASVTAAAAECGISRQHLHRLLARYREGGLDGLEPRSRRPASSPQATSGAGARPRRVAAGGAHGPAASTPARPPSPGTWSVRACRPHRSRPSGGSSTPRASSCPSRASARAAPGSGSRPPRPTRSGSPTSPTGASPTGAGSRSSAGSTTTPATCSGAPPSGGSRATTWSRRSPPPATPTAGPRPRSPTTGRCTRRASPAAATASSTCSPGSGVRQKNGAPGHPQTQGKIERFHQTLKRWLGRQPAARDLAALQAQLDAFRRRYNEQRPHRAIGRRTPASSVRARRPKAHPAGRRLARPLPPALRHHRRQGRHHPAARRASPPPQGRRRPRPHAGARHRRRAGGHGRRPRDRRGPLGPPHRARQGLLAQHAKRPRPMAGVPADRLTAGVAYDATHVSPMSRLKTLARPEGFEPPTLGSEDRCSGPLSYGRAARA